MQRSKYFSFGHVIESWRRSWSVALGALVALAPFAARSEIPQAVWRLQEIPFVYHGYATRYDCNALRMKLEKVLDAVAVHDSTTIRPMSCSLVGTSSQVASMQISVVSAAPLDAAARAEVAARSSQQVLLDRLGVRRGLGEEFPAHWRDVDLARQLKFESGDCELLRQIGAQVLSHLAVKILAVDSPCPITPRRFAQPRLKVQALAPLTID